VSDEKLWDEFPTSRHIFVCYLHSFHLFDLSYSQSNALYLHVLE